MRINSVPDVKCFCNNKNVLRAQSVVWHFVRHPVLSKNNLLRLPVSNGETGDTMEHAATLVSVLDKYINTTTNSQHN